MAEMEIQDYLKLLSLDDKDPYSFDIKANTYDKNMPYDDFFNKHMRNNVPCVIKNIGDSWEASYKWAYNNVIDFNYLSNQYGNMNVQVSQCEITLKDFHPKSDMRFSDYITYWKCSTKDKLLYLKDWHLRNAKPTDRFYTVPHFFGSDWLNEYAVDKQVDDFMFVYMGPTGSWTPVHADVYDSFSWSVNVCGRKKWYLFPPGEENKIINDKYNTVVIRFEPENQKDVTYFEIIQEKGDAIFVPSGWYHQVENQMDTISINHNWVNGTNILKVWEALKRHLVAVEKEIDQFSNLEEFPSLCQSMLQQSFGMNFEGFHKLIAYIGNKRVDQLNGSSNLAYGNVPLGRKHCLYDLKCISEMVTLIKEHRTYEKREYVIHEDFYLLQDKLKQIYAKYHNTSEAIDFFIST